MHLHIALIIVKGKRFKCLQQSYPLRRRNQNLSYLKNTQRSNNGHGFEIFIYFFYNSLFFVDIMFSIKKFLVGLLLDLEKTSVYNRDEDGSPVPCTMEGKKVGSCLFKLAST